MSNFNKLLLYTTFFFSVSNKVSKVHDPNLSFKDQSILTCILGLIFLVIIFIVHYLTEKKKDSE